MHVNGDDFDITFDEYDDQGVVTPYSNGDDSKLCFMIGQVTLVGVKKKTLLSLVNETYKLFKESPLSFYPDVDKENSK